MNNDVSMRSVDDRAAWWFLRLRDPDVSVEEIQAALDWQDEHSEHRAAFSRVAAVSRLYDGLAKSALRDIVEDAARFAAVARVVDDEPVYGMPSGERRRFTRTPRFLAMAASVSAAVALLILVVSQVSFGFKVRPTELARHATAIGESRVIKLPDDSEITLSGASSVSVDYSGKLRHVTLAAGEALFKVAHDSARQFIVTASGGQVTVLGTQFDVHRGLDGVTVTVVEGAVQVEPLSTGGNPRPRIVARLGAGHQLTYSASGELGAVAQVAADQFLAWRDGKLVFVNRSLADVVADLNRYLAKPIRIEAKEVGSLRFTGVVDVGSTDEWLQALQKSLPVRTVETDASVILLGKAPPPVGISR